MARRKNIRQLTAVNENRHLARPNDQPCAMFDFILMPFKLPYDLFIVFLQAFNHIYILI